MGIRCVSPFSKLIGSSNFYSRQPMDAPRFIWWLLKGTIAALPMVFGGPLPLLRHCKAYLMSKEVGAVDFGPRVWRTFQGGTTSFDGQDTEKHAGNTVDSEI